MKRTVRIMILLFTVLLSACAGGSGKDTPEDQAEKRPVPPLDREMPKEIARATFAMG